jgi:lipopolysaccharide/colanic/teichoic acid biosynthesis glycosyltransferase
MKTSLLERKLRRAIDFTVAIASLAALLPIMSLCALLVRLSSSGAVFFRQKRVGRRGKLFTLYKFRTMYEGGEGPSITAATDKRITPLGAFLRKYKLDELPQFYNVLRGEMCLVGPRPEVPDYVDLNDPVWRSVLSVRPGLTDPITIKLRNEEKFLAEAEDKDAFYREMIQPFKLKGYLEYLEEKTILTDINLIVRTALTVLFPSSAADPKAKGVRLSFLR